MSVAGDLLLLCPLLIDALKAALMTVIEGGKTMVDAATGQPLLTPGALKQIDSIMRLVENDRLSGELSWACISCFPGGTACLVRSLDRPGCVLLRRPTWR